jgi:hypothetical protein
MSKLLRVIALVTLSVSACVPGGIANSANPTSAVPATAAGVPTAQPQGSPAAENATGELTGTVAFQAPPTPAVELYFLSTTGDQYYVYDIAQSAGPAEFHATVAPGTYRVFAWTLDAKLFAAFSDPLQPQAGLGAVTVAAGQTVGGVDLRGPTSYPCSPLALPATPDGKYPALAATCGLLTGTISFDAPPTPALVIYAVNADDPANGLYAFTETTEAAGPAEFALAVVPGNYNLFAWAADGKRYAAFMTDDETKLETVTASAGQTAGSLKLRAPGPHPDRVPCEGVTLPATPDGRFEAAGCGTLAGSVGLQAPPTPPLVVYVVDVRGPAAGYWAYVQTTQVNGETPFEIDIPAGTYYLFAWTQDGAQYAGHLGADGALAPVTVETAKKVEGLPVRGPSSGPCAGFALPAAPDGRFPAVPKPC